jgi:formate hydrogenlyase subunit 3/multisubunit Na+/H+ antiporter MnhD subunit
VSEASVRPRWLTWTRRATALLPLAISGWFFATVARIVFHDHAGEFKHAHEWDAVTIPTILTLGLIFLIAAIATWFDWTSRRTWSLFAASPVAAVVLMFLLLWVDQLQRGHA